MAQTSIVHMRQIRKLFQFLKFSLLIKSYIEIHAQFRPLATIYGQLRPILNRPIHLYGLDRYELHACNSPITNLVHRG